MSALMRLRNGRIMTVTSRIVPASPTMGSLRFHFLAKNVQQLEFPFPKMCILGPRSQGTLRFALGIPM